jgi:hypothetical protein
LLLCGVVGADLEKEEKAIREAAKRNDMGLAKVY